MRDIRPRSVRLRQLGAAILCAPLVGCGATELAVQSLGEPEVTQIRANAPPGAAPGTCWGRDATPAVIETMTEQILMQPPQIHTDGSVLQPAVYKTETQQRIVQERREVWFRTPCLPELTPEFVASLQRALEARGHYSGPITGMLDEHTRRAVRAYQKPQGLDSGILSLAAARKLGLAVVETPGAGAETLPVKPG
ncbi:peptidoglycan-binding domain-containing protein [Pseudooceanicola sp.]|uniref:peptidoglycan-binding domain-containing protein n=1 Tax=Pseudooceanicola sp. TaxID=1914328 RepID=UPI002605CEA9|nr:peptidoglycan-binding domain-containing protein [Pseudooceanicola sp.]MDF1854783.1 peptidoglycan-binding domain-containing protein [Pseudooceanicola sp.]